MVAGASANQHNGLDIPFFYLGSDLFTHLTVTASGCSKISFQKIELLVSIIEKLLPKFFIPPLEK